jgi:hypothetical protein
VLPSLSVDFERPWSHDTSDEPTILLRIDISKEKRNTGPCNLILPLGTRPNGSRPRSVCASRILLRSLLGGFKGAALISTIPSTKAQDHAEIVASTRRGVLSFRQTFHRRSQNKLGFQRIHSTGCNRKRYQVSESNVRWQFEYLTIKSLHN